MFEIEKHDTTKCVCEEYWPRKEYYLSSSKKGYGAL